MRQMICIFDNNSFYKPEDLVHACWSTFNIRLEIKDARFWFLGLVVVCGVGVLQS